MQVPLNPLYVRMASESSVGVLHREVTDGCKHMAWLQQSEYKLKRVLKIGFNEIKMCSYIIGIDFKYNYVWQGKLETVCYVKTYISKMFDLINECLQSSIM